MGLKLYTASKEYHCCGGCDEIIKVKESFHIIEGDFFKKNHIKSYILDKEKKNVDGR